MGFWRRLRTFHRHRWVYGFDLTDRLMTVSAYCLKCGKLEVEQTTLSSKAGKANG